MKELKIKKIKKERKKEKKKKNTGRWAQSTDPDILSVIDRQNPVDSSSIKLCLFPSVCMCVACFTFDPEVGCDIFP
jgi:hypothetical protein